MAEINSGIDTEVVQKQFRDVYRLTPQKVELEAIKAGDIFFMLPANETDDVNIDAHELLLATADAIVLPDGHDSTGRRNASVEAKEVKLIDQDDDAEVGLEQFHGKLKDTPEWKKKKTKKKKKKKKKKIRKINRSIK